MSGDGSSEGENEIPLIRLFRLLIRKFIENLLLRSTTVTIQHWYGKWRRDVRTYVLRTDTRIHSAMHTDEYHEYCLRCSR